MCGCVGEDAWVFGGVRVGGWGGGWVFVSWLKFIWDISEFAKTYLLPSLRCYQLIFQQSELFNAGKNILTYFPHIFHTFHIFSTSRKYFKNILKIFSTPRIYFPHHKNILAYFPHIFHIFHIFSTP